MAIVEATDDTLEYELESGVVLLDFWAPWCGPCKSLAPVLEAIAEEYEGRLKVVKVDADSNMNSVAAHQVRAVPTVILFKDGQQVTSKSGALSKGVLMAMIEKAMA